MDRKSEYVISLALSEAVSKWVNMLACFVHIHFNFDVKNIKTDVNHDANMQVILSNTSNNSV